ncbi:hypothetical protein SLEP1_g6841 [Rubroshorea leprosula]|uniref:Uncharacterized protein n=1 Tax=Rubroshorea leprosula TaxID=152421 RepID=A0AAV5HWH8_9ROSI|nr:hypothetical protein SLEP1_g6841 [Rubroshorea leprosula]
MAARSLSFHVTVYLFWWPFFSSILCCKQKWTPCMLMVRCDLSALVQFGFSLVSLVGGLFLEVLLLCTIAGGVELSFGIYMPNVELLAQDSEQKLLQCAHFCSKSMSSPTSFSAEMYLVSSLLNRSEKFSKFKASVAEYFPGIGFNFIHYSFSI